MSRKKTNPGAGQSATGADNKAGGLWIDSNIRRVSRKDAAWFAKRPHRNHRVRYAIQAEIEESRILGNPSPEIAGIFPLHIIVKQFEPGLRTRGLVALHVNWAGCDEEQAAALWAEMEGARSNLCYLIRAEIGEPS